MDFNSVRNCFSPNTINLERTLSRGEQDLKKVSGKTISEEEFLEAYCLDKDLNNKKL